MLFSKSALKATFTVWAAGSLVQMAHAKQCTRGKLFLTDHDQPRVAIYDLDTPNDFSKATHLDLKHGIHPTTYFTYASGSSLFVGVASLGYGPHSGWPLPPEVIVGGVTYIDTGVRLANTADAVTKTDPKVLDFQIDCVFPAHWSVRGDEIGQFCDGNGSADQNATVWIVDETRLAAYTEGGSSPSPLLYSKELTESHHGLASVMGERDVLVTRVSPEGVVTGMEILNYLTGELQHGLNDPNDASKSCSGWHGDTHQGDTWAFGCDEDHGGILVVTTGGGSPKYSSRLLQYPQDDGFTSHRTSFIKSHPLNPYFVGTFGNCWTGECGLVAFDPVQGDAQLTTEQVQVLPAKNCAGDYQFEQSAGQLFVIWLATGVLQVYAVNPWSLVSEIQVVEGMTDCGVTTMVVGHGYAYVHVNQTLHEVDLRDSSSITATSYPVEAHSHNWVGIGVDVVAGVPPGFECDGPTVPDVPSANRKGQAGFTVLHFEAGTYDAELAPGSAAQKAFFRRLRNDVGQALKVPIDRVYITDFRPSTEAPKQGKRRLHHGGDEEYIAKVFFVDAGPNDVNKEQGVALKDKFTALVANKETTPLPGLLANVQGQVTNESPLSSSSTQATDDDDSWPTGAKATVGVLAALLFCSVVGLFVVWQKAKKALSEKELAVREAEQTSGMDDKPGMQETAIKVTDEEEPVTA